MNPKEGKGRGGLPNGGKGRPPGFPNKTTRDVREAIRRVAEDNAENFAEWLKTVAIGDGKSVKPDPAKAADLYLKAIEYHIPKLARTEVAGDQDQPMQMVVKWAQEK
jgi:hypothetical protein